MPRRQNKDFFVAVDSIRSLENIGSIFRTADAAGVQKIFLCGISGTPPHKKIAKTALGAEQWVLWEYRKQLWKVIDELKSRGVEIVVLEQTKEAIPYTKYKPKFPLVLIIGNEVNGVSAAVLKRADVAIQIPMKGQKESLNVAVAFGVAAFEIAKKL